MDTTSDIRVRERTDLDASSTPYHLDIWLSETGLAEDQNRFIEALCELLF